MPNIINGTGTNPTAPGLYIQVISPPTYAQGIAVDVIGVSGTASWGQLNSPTLLGSPSEVISTFGGITSAALTDAHDLCTDLMIAFSQAGNQSTLQAYGVRVSDGTDVKASYALLDVATPTPATGATATALYSGVLGNDITITLATGAAANTIDVTLIPFSGGLTEKFPGLPNTSAFWAAFVSAVNNGLQNVRGPSQLITAAVGTSTAAPALGTFSMTGGTDGRSAVTTAQLVGSNASSPVTGLYTLESLKPAVGIIWVAGLTDNTGLANLVSIAEATPAWCLFSAAAGAAANTTTMISTLQGYGQATANLSFTGDWIYWYDPVNGQLRLVPPYAFIGGTVATLPAQNSPLNVPVQGVVGTERNNPYGTPQPYTQAELGALDNAGIIVITNPIPAGSVYGMASGRNTSINVAESPVEYTRLTNYFALTLAGVMGQFVGKLQSTRTNDPLRAQVKHVLDNLCQSSVDSGQIDSYLNTCTFAQSGDPNSGVNTPTTISQHYLYARSDIKYLSSTWYFVLSLQGGTTVVTSGSSSGNTSP